MHRYHKSYFQLIWPFYGFIQLYEVKLQKISYLREFSAQVSQIVFWVHLTVLRLITVVISRKTVKSTQNTICDTCALNSRRYDIFEVLLHTVVWGKTSKISYLREFSAQVSQFVFSSPLTVLGHIPTVWGKISKISFLCEFSAQVSQMLFWAHLTVLRLITTIMRKNFNNLISPGFQCTSITKPVLRSF